MSESLQDHHGPFFRWSHPIANTTRKQDPGSPFKLSLDDAPSENRTCSYSSDSQGIRDSVW